MPKPVDVLPAETSDEIAWLEGRAKLGFALGVVSVLIGWLCTIPLGVFALFLAIQAQAGAFRLEDQPSLSEPARKRLERLQQHARWSLALGATGTVLFLISLIRFVWLYLSSA